MKRKITVAGIVSLVLAFFLTEVAWPQKRPPSTKPATRSTVSRDGIWSGKTLQNQGVRFVVEKGKITEFTIGGRIVGYGCSSSSSSTVNINKAIVNNAFSFGSYAGPGAVSLNVNGVFTGASAVRGTAVMELHPIPGPPPGVPGHVPSCGGITQTKWAAIKGDTPPADIQALLAPVSSKTPAGPRLISLVGPKEGDLLDNGCSNLKEPIIWEFQWTPAKGATRYHLYVIHETGVKPVIDKQDLTALLT